MEAAVDDSKYRCGGGWLKPTRITRSFVTRLILAPDIVEGILGAGQPKGLHLEELSDAERVGRAVLGTSVSLDRRCLKRI